MIDNILNISMQLSAKKKTFILHLFPPNMPLMSKEHRNVPITSNPS